jgi:hypothetical protein
MSASCSRERRLAQVGKQWTLVLSLLRAAVQLADRDDRHLEFLCQQLQGTGESDTSCWRFSTRLPLVSSWR